MDSGKEDFENRQPSESTSMMDRTENKENIENRQPNQNAAMDNDKEDVEDQQPNENTAMENVENQQSDERTEEIRSFDDLVVVSRDAQDEETKEEISDNMPALFDVADSPSTALSQPVALNKITTPEHLLRPNCIDCCGLTRNNHAGSNDDATVATTEDVLQTTNLNRDLFDIDDQTQGMSTSSGPPPPPPPMSMNGHEDDSDSKDVDEVEIMLDDDATSRRSIMTKMGGFFGFAGLFGGRRRSRGLDDRSLPARRRKRRGNFDLDEVESQLEVGGGFSVTNKNGTPTSITMIKKPDQTRRRRYCILICLLCLIFGGLVAGIIYLLLGRDGDEVLTSEELKNGNTTDEQEDRSIDGNNEETPGIFGGGVLRSGCFHLETDSTFICMFAEGDGLCRIIVGDDECTSCEVCDVASGAVRADCTNLPVSDEIINDSCLDTASAFEETLLAGLLLEVSSAPTPSPSSPPTPFPTLASLSYTTGCFDYSVFNHRGAVVCLSDADPTDGLCKLAVDGVQCSSCTVCAESDSLSADCSNIGTVEPAVMNEQCDGPSALAGTVLEVFPGSPYQVNPDLGFWSEVENAGGAGGGGNVGCQDTIETEFSCYEPDAGELKIGYRNCRPRADDWLAIFAEGSDPSDLNNPVGDKWLWTSSNNNIDEEQWAVLTFRADISPGSYRPFLVRDGDDRKFLGFAPGPVFTVAATVAEYETCLQHEQSRRVLQD